MWLNGNGLRKVLEKGRESGTTNDVTLSGMSFGCAPSRWNPPDRAESGSGTKWLRRFAPVFRGGPSVKTFYEGVGPAKQRVERPKWVKMLRGCGREEA